MFDMVHANRMQLSEPALDLLKAAAEHQNKGSGTAYHYPIKRGAKDVNANALKELEKAGLAGPTLVARTVVVTDEGLKYLDSLDQ